MNLKECPDCGGYNDAKDRECARCGKQFNVHGHKQDDRRNNPRRRHKGKFDDETDDDGEEY